MPDIINPSLILNWENWLRVLLMVAIGGAFFHLTQQYLDSKKDA